MFRLRLTPAALAFALAETHVTTLGLQSGADEAMKKATRGPTASW